jgi:hypothetical protein
MFRRFLSLGERSLSTQLRLPRPRSIMSAQRRRANTGRSPMARGTRHIDPLLPLQGRLCERAGSMRKRTLAEGVGCAISEVGASSDRLVITGNNKASWAVFSASCPR